MQSVWVVEAGVYSSKYRVVGVFSTKENAEIIAEKMDGDVEEWHLDPWVDKIKEGKHPYYMKITRDGDVERIKKQEWRNVDSDEDVNMQIEKHADIEYLGGIVMATGIQHALKIAYEIYEKYIADGKWPEKGQG